LGNRDLLFRCNYELVDHLSNAPTDGACGDDSLAQTIQRLRGKQWSHALVAASPGRVGFTFSYNGGLQVCQYRTPGLQLFPESIRDPARDDMVRGTLGLPILYGAMEDKAGGPESARDSFW
jgi:hypothetical protein